MSPPLRRGGFLLECVPLEGRIAPDAKPRLISPVGSTTLISSTEIVAELRSSSPIQDLANITNYLGLGSVVNVAQSYVVFANGPLSYVSIALQPGADPTAVVASYAPITSLFSWVAPDYVYATSDLNASTYLERIPNDPLYSQQWHLPLVNAPAAWDTTFGDPNLIVSVFDDGIDINHPDLQANIYRNPNENAANGLDNDHNGYVGDLNGWNFASNNNNVLPDNPLTDTHGTQVAGLLAASIDNAAGVAGLAGRVKILPIKVVGNGTLTSLSMARAAAYSVMMGAKIITCSINIDPLVGDPSFESTANYVYNRGLLWFNSAGNYNAANPPRQGFEQFLLVSATNSNNQKASYSNYGTGIDISAPGGDIGNGLVTTTTVAAGSYGTAYGTSMAAPLAAATAALVWSAHPGYSRDQVASRIMASATNLDSFNTAYVGMLGSGLINAGDAVNAANVVTTMGPVSGLPTSGIPISGALGTISVRINAPVDASTVIPDNFQLVGAGGDNTFGTTDDVTIPLTIANTQPIRIGTNEILLSEDRVLAPGLYRLTVKSGGLLDPFGNAVVAVGTGGDLVVDFGVANSVTGTVYADVNGTGSNNPGDPVRPGQPVYIDTNNNGIPDLQTGTSNAAIDIPDDPTKTITSTIAISGLANPVAAVTVSVDVSHPQPGDLRIWLTSPQGTKILLSGNRYFAPTSTSNQLTIDFNDFAPFLAATNSNVVAPDEPLSTFNGENGNGDWTLSITDTTPGDSGSLLGWSINVTDEPSAVSDGNGHYSITGTLPPGSYNVLPYLQPGQTAVPGPILIEPLLPNKSQSVDVGVRSVGAVTGHVTLGNGQPVAGAIVYDDANNNGRLDPDEISAATAPGGSYTLLGLPLGVHTLRIAAPLGYDVSLPAGGAITVTVGNSTSLLPQNNFTLSARTGMPLPSLGSVSPDLRNSGTPQFDLNFNLPVTGLTLANFTLTRNGISIPLDGATLIGSGGTYHLIGTAAQTALAGQYRLTVTAPGGSNAPSTSTSWIVDLTPPTVQSLSVTRSANYLPASDASVGFSESVTGVTLANFTLTRDGVPVPLTGVVLLGSGSQYSISGLTTLTTTYGNYVLSVGPATVDVRDAAGNALTGNSSIRFTVGTPPVVFQDRLVMATAEGTTTTINVLNSSGTQLFTLMPFGPNFTGGARVTTADVNGDGIADIVVGSGPGRPPQVFAFDGRNGTLIRSFFAFEASFTGGVNVATADFNKDGKPDLIVTPDLGGGPRVRVLSPDGITVYADFFGIADPAFRGGARATAGDLNGDGTPDLIVAAGFGGGPRIAAYDGNTIGQATPTKLFGDFFAFEPSLRNGVTLAATDLNGDGFSDLIVGGGPGGAPRVLALDGKNLTTNGTQTTLANFFAGNTSNRNGTNLAAKDLNGDGVPDLLATDGPAVRVYFSTTIQANGTNPTADQLFNPFNSLGGVYVG